MAHDVKKMTRAKLFRAIHAEGLKRKLDHDGLRDLCKERFGVHSMGDMSDAQLQDLYFSWTKKKTRRKTQLPRAGYHLTGELEMISREDMETLKAAFRARNWGPETERAFIRRQLGGRDEIRSRRDFHRVFSGVRAMNRREGKVA